MYSNLLEHPSVDREIAISSVPVQHNQMFQWGPAVVTHHQSAEGHKHTGQEVTTQHRSQVPARRPYRTTVRMG